MVPKNMMIRRFRRPTLLAIFAQPGSETAAPGGTLAINAWRGVRTVLVMLYGANDARLRAAVARSAFLLSVENNFHWEGGEESALRLARILRSFQPGVVITNEAAQAQSEQAWAFASDKTVVMPGLALFDASQSRLWRARFQPDLPAQNREGAEESGLGRAYVDVSAARPLLRALRFFYYGTARESILTSWWRPEDGAPFVEVFDLLQGRVVTESPTTTDLFAGLYPSPSRPSISFLG